MCYVDGKHTLSRASTQPPQKHHVLSLENIFAFAKKLFVTFDCKTSRVWCLFSSRHEQRLFSFKRPNQKVKNRQQLSDCDVPPHKLELTRWIEVSK